MRRLWSVGARDTYDPLLVRGPLPVLQIILQPMRTSCRGGSEITLSATAAGRVAVPAIDTVDHNAYFWPDAIRFHPVLAADAEAAVTAVSMSTVSALFTRACSLMPAPFLSETLLGVWPRAAGATHP